MRNFFSLFNFKSNFLTIFLFWLKSNITTHVTIHNNNSFKILHHSKFTEVKLVRVVSISNWLAYPSIKNKDIVKLTL